MILASKPAPVLASTWARARRPGWQRKLRAAARPARAGPSAQRGYLSCQCRPQRAFKHHEELLAGTALRRPHGCCRQPDGSDLQLLAFNRGGGRGKHRREVRPRRDPSAPRSRRGARHPRSVVHVARVVAVHARALCKRQAVRADFPFVAAVLTERSGYAAWSRCRAHCGRGKSAGICRRQLRRWKGICRWWRSRPIATGAV